MLNFFIKFFHDFILTLWPKVHFLPDSRSSRNSASTSTGTKSSRSARNLAENVTGSIWRVDASANGLVPKRSTLGDANAKRRESIFGDNNFMPKHANLDDGDVRLSQGRHDAQGEDRFVCWNQDIRKGMQGAGSPAFDEQLRPRSRSRFLGRGLQRQNKSLDRTNSRA